MLENFQDQGAGLRKFALSQPQRLITLASHGQKDLDLPFLWALCFSLTRLGYTLLVLDATTVESPDNPGLQECLEFNHADEPDNLSAAWTVLPSALGLAKLCLQNNNGLASLENLTPLFHAYSVIVLYVPTEIMVTALNKRPIEPLLAVSAGGYSLFTAYQALKKILKTSELHPGVVSLVHHSDGEAESLVDPVANSLQHCAQEFLGQSIQTHRLKMAYQDQVDDEEMEKLALRLLENAMPLNSTPQNVSLRSH